MKPTPFGRYLLLDKVASGGMAEVWRAKLQGDGDFQRIVAIKKILPHVSEDQEFITMFRDEANITVQLQHSNIGQVTEFNKVDDIYFIAMEYCSGKDVKTVWSYCRSRKTTIPLELSAFIVQQMAEGLDYAHRKRDNFGNELGIVHRDVSPQNVIVSWDGEVKVIDFGIAKAADKAGHTRAGTLKGKFAYMAPEQIRGLPLDGRADVFALGVCLYELVTGERGFQAESEFSLLEMVRNVEIRPPTMVNNAIPQELERIVFKALAKDREHRYQSGAELSEDLQRWALGQGKRGNRQMLGQYLRENFTVDYDKERLRLESYKEMTWEPPPQPAAPPAPAAPPPPSPAELAVQAAMAGETSAFNAGDASSPFAAMPGAPAGGSAMDGTGTGYSMTPGADATPQTAGGISPPLAVTQIRGPGVPAIDNSAITQGPGGGIGKKLAIAAVLGLFVIGIGVAASVFLLRGSATVAVTILNTNGVTVRLDGKEVGTASPNFVIEDVSTGPHSVILEKSGFEMLTVSVTPKAGMVVPVKVTLERAKGRISVNSTVPNAEIWIDGEKTKFVTPKVVSVPGGIEHRILVKKEGFFEGTKTVKVAAGAQSSIDVVLKPAKIILEISTQPPGADAKWAGGSLGKTPTRLILDAGSPYPQIVLTKRGCTKVETTIPYDDDKAVQKQQFNLKCR